MSNWWHGLSLDHFTNPLTCPDPTRPPNLNPSSSLSVWHLGLSHCCSNTKLMVSFHLCSCHTSNQQSRPWSLYLDHSLPKMVLLPISLPQAWWWPTSHCPSTWRCGPCQPTTQTFTTGNFLKYQCFQVSNPAGKGLWLLSVLELNPNPRGQRDSPYTSHWAGTQALVA